MLKYNHLFNKDVNYPYHIHVIESSTNIVAVSINNIQIGYISPNRVTSSNGALTFGKYVDLKVSILELMISGSAVLYPKETANLIYAQKRAKYIKEPSGMYLSRVANTNKYYWSYDDKGVFYFNPLYFRARRLWEEVNGYIPRGEEVYTFWDEPRWDELFVSDSYTVSASQVWSGEKEITPVEPVTIDYFNNDTTGYFYDYYVSEVIKELQDLKDGDVITLDNGIDRLSIEVKNCWTEAVYSANHQTTRPLIHVPIDIVNPNVKKLFTYPLNPGQEKVINLVLYNNNIQFKISRSPA